MQHRSRVSTSRAFQFGALAAVLVACAEAAPTDNGTGGTGGGGGTTPSSGGNGTGGASATGGSSATGGTTSGKGGTSGTGGASATGGTTSGNGGSASGGGGTGGSATGGGAGNGGSGGSGAGTGGSSAGGSTNGGTGAGGELGGGRGGRPGSGGMPGAGMTGMAGSGTAGTGTAGSSSNPPGGDNSVAYIGCSMAYNIGTGYKRVGGKVMWNSDSYQTSAMVVQNWTDSNSSSWQLFDQKMSSIGGKDKVKAIMIQICIFSSRATDAELRSMVASARQHVNPGTHIYMVGQPQYEAGHECSLAGTGGAKWTDDQAQALAADSSVNQDMTYLGQFKLDSTKGEVLSDSCHASSPTGENVLGDQAKAFFGG